MRISDWSSDVCSSDLPGLTKGDLPNGEGWAVESITLSTHNGTHMDAPWHFHSTTDRGATPAPSIDEAPLDLFFRPGVKLDFSHLPAGHVVGAAEEIGRASCRERVCQSV